jgi:hypothetical protein
MPFDFLERNYAVWLQANEIELEKEEKVIIVFPRGNLVTPGPAVQLPDQRGGIRTEPCDVILTDRRFIIGLPGKISTLPLERIETCMVSETGGFMGKKPLLIIGTHEEMHTVRFPSGSPKSRSMLNSVASFALSMSLK